MNQSSVPATADDIKAVDGLEADLSVSLYNTASTLILTEDEEKILSRKVKRAEVEVRPDGLIYLPQVYYRKTLNDAFGRGQWALVQTRVFVEGTNLFFDGALFVRGKFVARAIGEAEYHKNNKKQTWATVYESAKSDCIVRCCKDLSVTLELWQPAFGRKWLKENAVKVVCKENNDHFVIWRRKDVAPKWKEKKFGIGIYDSEDNVISMIERNDNGQKQTAPQSENPRDAGRQPEPGRPDPQRQPEQQEHPKHENQEAPSTEDQTLPIGEWIVPKGKYNGQRLKDIAMSELANYLDWLNKNTPKSVLVEPITQYLGQYKETPEDKESDLPF